MKKYLIWIVFTSALFVFLTGCTSETISDEALSPAGSEYEYLVVSSECSTDELTQESTETEIFAKESAPLDLNENSTEYHNLFITVLIKKEYSQFGKEYSPADFDEDLIAYVEIMNQIESAADTKGYDVEYWQQMLTLYLKEPGAENVQKAIEAAYKNPEVEIACILNSWGVAD